MKSPDAFRTISEVSKETKIPTHVLRFWESKFSNINLVEIFIGGVIIKIQGLKLSFLNGIILFPIPSTNKLDE